MTDRYYYKRTEEYSKILFRVTTGCFPVPMVHSCVLINLTLQKSNSLTYNPKKAKDYDGPTDDVITFAVNAKNIGMCAMNLCKTLFIIWCSFMRF